MALVGCLFLYRLQGFFFFLKATWLLKELPEYPDKERTATPKAKRCLTWAGGNWYTLRPSFSLSRLYRVIKPFGIEMAWIPNTLRRLWYK